jgi:hypothetical protein
MSAPTATQPTQPAQPPQVEIMPSPAVLTQTAKLAMKKDKAIHLDYYVETATGKAFLGQDTTTGEKMLVKSMEEFTSLVQNNYKVGEDYIIETENSIYIVNGKLQKRRIEASSLRHDD